MQRLLLASELGSGSQIRDGATSPLYRPCRQDRRWREIGASRFSNLKLAVVACGFVYAVAHCCRDVVLTEVRSALEIATEVMTKAVGGQSRAVRPEFLPIEHMANLKHEIKKINNYLCLRL